ncbi:DUF2064 domain-containing protein [Actinoplanes sp. NPDC051494]|uniref:TIGR04282 family arsenosugar biosynthesis glycosyltransferase n=1 Tax=Actinoplanes sp. NPDC051494 TaxID=3363907 RepID=UPI00378E43F9
MNARLLVLAKTPVPGRVKTRLCPPCTPAQAAAVAAAALADTLDAVTAARATARVLVVDGDHPEPPGWTRTPQRGGMLGERLADAFTRPLSLLIGMDTPQVTATLLDAATRRLGTSGVDAVLGLAEDGGWWALGLRDPADARVLRDIETSTADTGAKTLAALTARGLTVSMLPVLRDVDTAADAHAVAALCAPGSRFASTVTRVVRREVPA